MNREKQSKDYNPAEEPRTGTDKAFRISLYLKALDGILEVLGGILLLLIKPAQIDRLAGWLTQGELSKNPHDFISNHILKTAHSLTGTSLLIGAIYLLAQGSIKIFLVYQVLRGRAWAYLVLITVISLFVIYQVYRLIVVNFSIGLTLLTAFDLFIIYMAQKEYRLHQKRLAS